MLLKNKEIFLLGQGNVTFNYIKAIIIQDNLIDEMYLLVQLGYSEKEEVKIFQELNVKIDGENYKNLGGNTEDMNRAIYEAVVSELKLELE